MGIKITEWLQDNFFQGIVFLLSQAGHLFVVMGVAVVIYLIVDKRLGGRMLIFYFTSMAANAFMKEWIGRGRPNTVNENITIIENSTQPSMPSGHAQGFASVLAPIALFFKNRKRSFLWCGLALLFLCFSRVYLGQHYPSDVLVGAVVGAAIAVGLELVYYFGGERANLYLLGLIPVVVTLLAVFNGFRDAFVSGGMLIGCLLGIFFEQKFVGYEVKGSVLNRVAKLLFSLLVTSVAITPFSLMIMLIGQLNIFIGLLFVMMGLSFTLLCPFLIKKVFDRKEAPVPAADTAEPETAAEQA